MTHSGHAVVTAIRRRGPAHRATRISSEAGNSRLARVGLGQSKPFAIAGFALLSCTSKFAGASGFAPKSAKWIPAMDIRHIQQP
jgi:hypothetical protein